MVSCFIFVFAYLFFLVVFLLFVFVELCAILFVSLVQFVRNLPFLFSCSE